MTSYYSEFFSGIQGEGIFVGTRQIFVRFYGCNINCSYCDTLASKAEKPLFCEVESKAGSREFLYHKNPLSSTTAAKVILNLNNEIKHNAVSFTGGEPLLYPADLNKMVDKIHSYLPIHIETNGTLYNNLAKLDFIPDHISLDVKLPSLTFCDDDVKTMNKNFILKYQENFNKSIINTQDPIQIKIVFGADNIEEIKETLLWISEICDYPVILQPVTAGNLRVKSPTPFEVLKAQEIGLQLLKDVRVIPQTHVMMQQK